MEDRHWRAVWAGWVVYFATAEYVAIRSNNHKAPLSYFLRHTLGIRRSPLHRRAGQVAFISGFAWLAHHLYEWKN